MTASYASYPLAHSSDRATTVTVDRDIAPLVTAAAKMSVIAGSQAG